MARLSRRGVVAGVGAAPLLGAGAAAAAPASVDPVLVLTEHYGDLDRRKDVLLRRWGRIEARLARRFDWFKLSEAERRALPQAQELHAIDAEIERIGKESVYVLRRLRAVPARTLEGAIAKLGVVADMIEPDDYPSAHRVLLGAIADLQALGARR
jgi:hypothetical protein